METPPEPRTNPPVSPPLGPDRISRRTRNQRPPNGSGRNLSAEFNEEASDADSSVPPSAANGSIQTPSHEISNTESEWNPSTRDMMSSSFRRSRRRSRKRPATSGMHRADVEDMVRKGVADKWAELEANRKGTSAPSTRLSDGPLAPALYRVPLDNFKFPSGLPTFRGAGDTQDPQSFIFGFRERLRLSGAKDAITCRMFTTCLSGEAWDWYMTLKAGSISCFDELARAFLARYNLLRPPKTSCESLLDITQGPKERTRNFADRFVRASREVQNYSEGLALAAILNGLRQEGPGTLRYDARKREFTTLQEFLAFAEGYIRAEDDASRFKKPRSRSPPRNPARQPPPYDRPREQNPRRNPQPRSNDHALSFEPGAVLRDGTDGYRPHFVRYAPFTKGRGELLHIARRMITLPPPLPSAIFEVKDPTHRCEYHGSHGHATGDCLQLRDILERMAREGKLVDFINPEFFRRYKRSYNGEQPEFKKKFQYRADYAGPRHPTYRADHTGPRHPEYRADYAGPRHPENPTSNQETPDPIPPNRQRSPSVHVISGGLRAIVPRPLRAGTRPYPSVLTVTPDNERKRLRPTELISFSEKDFEKVTWPHEDPLVLRPKIGGYRVRRVLVDTGSSADILFLPAFTTMGLATSKLERVTTPLVGFTGDSIQPNGVVQLNTIFGTHPKTTEVLIDFLVVDAPSAYNAIIGRGTLNKIGAVVSSPHLKIKFPTAQGIGEERGEQELARDCYLVSVQSSGGAVHQVDAASNEQPVPTGPDTVSSDPVPPDEEVDQVTLAPGKTTNIGRALQGTDRDDLISFLQQNSTVFAWTAADMPGIPRSIAEHALHINPNARPVRQKKRNMGPERRAAVTKEVDRLLTAGFIRNANCPEWMANPVLVKKPNGDWRMCIDFTDLNKACPMDPFPLPKIDQLVDSTSGHAFLSFMDAFSGYNQIKMREADEEKTAFTTHAGLYCYRVMPFGLKNAGATFQRMVNTVFRDQLGRNMEAYVDDLLVKSMSGHDHVRDLKETFATLNKANMKLNPAKSFFGLAGGKFLGFMVSKRGIEIHPSKSKAILDMTPPRNLKELQTLTGRLAALNRFIARLGDVCFPFFKAMRKSARFEWTDECATAFGKVKEYLANPPCLSRPCPGDTLVMYLATSHCAVSTALVREEGKEQRPIYFVSHVLRDAETRYSQIEKAAYAVVVAARKLRPYFQSHPIKIYTGVPLRKAFSNFDSSGRILSWALELSEFDISFHPQTAMKSQIFADFIADYSGLSQTSPGKWDIYVDGASSLQGAGAGIALIGPQGEVLNYALHFQFQVTNNTAEYEAMLAGLRLALGLGAREVHLRSDSELAVRQINDECRVLDDRLRQYREQFLSLKARFDDVQLEHVPRNRNSQADALSKLGAAGNLDKDRPVIVMDIPESSLVTHTQAVLAIHEPGDAWYAPIWNYLTSGTLPEDPLAARRLKKIAPLYSLFFNRLYKRGYLRPWLRCIHNEKAKEMLVTVHEGICGSHQGAKTLAKRILRAGFYWPTMQQDATDLVRRCEKCQIHSKLSNVPSYDQVSISGAWPFDLWGIDIVGPFPVATQQRRWIIVAVEYFTKWVEAEALAQITAAAAEKFIWRNIICRFGLPHALVSDNGTQFNAASTVAFLSGLGIRNNFTSVSHPASNGLAEVTNRTILEGLKRKVAANRKNWPDLLDEILWAYRNTPREATQQTPYSLVFGMEAVTPLELVTPSLRTATYSEDDNSVARATELDLITEFREKARIRTQEYQRRVKRAFDKKVTPRGFEPGDLVLRKVEATGKHVGKLEANWEGPYRVLCPRGKGSYELEDTTGSILPRPWNVGHLRKFYV